MPELSLLIRPEDRVPPHLFSTDHNEKVCLVEAGALGRIVTVDLGEGRELHYGVSSIEKNLRVMTMLAAMALPVIQVTGPVIITGLTPNTIIRVLAATRGTLTEIV